MPHAGKQPKRQPDSNQHQQDPGYRKSQRRAVEQHETQVAPAVAPVRRCGGVLRRREKIGGDLRDAQPENRGLHQHFAGEFHPSDRARASMASCENRACAIHVAAGRAEENLCQRSTRACRGSDAERMAQRHVPSKRLPITRSYLREFVQEKHSPATVVATSARP